MKCTVVIVNSRFLQRPQKQLSRGSQLIRRRFTRTNR